MSVMLRVAILKGLYIILYSNIIFNTSLSLKILTIKFYCFPCNLDLTKRFFETSLI